MNTTHKLSLWRLFLLIGALGLLAYFSFTSVQTWKDTRAVAGHKPWFAAYVDVTSTPAYAFEELGNTETPQAILSFIVSSSEEACIPTWGNYYTLEEAAVSLDLDRRIARLQQQNGRVAVSFGGALNNELALNCTDETKLYNAYYSVIKRYNIDTIDLDLENTSLQNKNAAVRRAKVIAKLQQDMRDNGKHLAVWLTLPVAPQGLTPEGTDAVAAMLGQNVDLAGVNVMTMDYGESKDEQDSMYEASAKALNQTHRQLGILYEQAGIHLNSNSVWRKMGATPMIGQNDVVEEVFTIEDAEALNAFSIEKGIGRMSMWSANRDVRCGDNYVDVHIVSDSCSGVKNDKHAFAKALSIGFDGDITQNSTIITVEDPETTEQVEDDPENSPYQIWNENGTYLAGTKVVWHRNVYEAKWWSKGDLPDNPVLQEWETPWRLVGPVLPGEKPVKLPTLPPGTYPNWSGTVEYEVGQRVLYEGIPFQAKWWNQGQSPAASASHADSSPWVPLTQLQIEEMLEHEVATSEAR